MHHPLRNQGAGLLRAYRTTLRVWAHIAAPILAITLAGRGFWFTSPAQPQEAPSAPLFENVTLGPRFSPDPLTLRGVSGGSLAAAAIAGRPETLNGPCVGFVDEQPDHRLVLTTFFNYLSLKIQSAQDTTLVIRGPGGSWCNDEVDGKNPGITGQWLSGTYEVWVGSYKKDQYYPYQIKITAVPLLNPGPFRR